MASLDVNRPAAMEQLQILGSQIGVDTLPIVKGEDPLAIAKRAKHKPLWVVMIFIYLIPLVAYTSIKS